MTTGKDKYYIYEGNNWYHKTPLKLLVNPLLRKIQFFTRRPYVIASKTEFKEGNPKFLGYSFRRIGDENKIVK